MLTIEEMAAFCKRKGFVYPNSEIYGGLSGFFDYGPLGVELKNNIKQSWWHFHVHSRKDIVGMDGSIITHPFVWKASGHVESFEDIMLACSKCRQKVRGDHLIADALHIPTEGMTVSEATKLVQEKNIKCPHCKGTLQEAKPFNLMFKTEIGPEGGIQAYLRPETAQLIFANFKLIAENSRLKLPFGIAQIGKAFRNEISPRDFLFRAREFEQMEIEYFCHPEKKECPLIDGVQKHTLAVFSAEMQEKNIPPKRMTIETCLNTGIIKNQWQAYWLAKEIEWFTANGANPGNFRIRQHLEKEKSHYARDTWDIEYQFPFGFKELQGIADRGDFDLQQHIKHSKQDLSLFDEETKKRVVPHVVSEPSQGVDRAFLVFLFDAYQDDKQRGNIVLKLHPKLAPYKAAVFPLITKLDEHAKKVYGQIKDDFNTFYDSKGSVGRRYARADEIGIPFCITFDFDSMKDESITIRSRDTTKQIRIKIEELKTALRRLMDGEPLESCGAII